MESRIILFLGVGFTLGSFLTFVFAEINERLGKKIPIKQIPWLAFLVSFSFCGLIIFKIFNHE